MNQVLTCHINEKWNLLLNDFFSMQDWNLRVRIGWRNNVSHEQIFWGGGTHSSKYAWKNYCLKKYLHKSMYGCGCEWMWTKSFINSGKTHVKMQS
jgi:hypothetical protein